ncbi:MAG: DUF748 domain-containing protein [Candidatus Electrothrix sp. EH2]|nr:DUF748 domain-containing protein [Candidatus Electrothrix sp. EH2]
MENLTLNSPLFLMPGDTEQKPSGGVPLTRWPGQVFNLASLPVDLMIKHLTIHNGTVQRGGKKQGSRWEYLQLALTGYRNRNRSSAEKNQAGAAQTAALSFSARQGETKVQFQGSTAPDLSLTGNITLSNLDSTLLQPYLGAEKALQLSGGKARLVMQTDPGQKKYTVEELTLEQPQLVLKNLSQKADSSSLPFLIRVGELLDPASLPFDLRIRHLTVNKGKIQRQKERPWEELQLELNKYRNHQQAKAAALSFSARQGKTKMQFQGNAAPDLSLTGNITLSNLDSSLLQSYLGAEKALRLSGEQINLTGVLQRAQAGGKKQPQ